MQRSDDRRGEICVFQEKFTQDEEMKSRRNKKNNLENPQLCPVSPVSFGFIVLAVEKCKLVIMIHRSLLKVVPLQK